MRDLKKLYGDLTEFMELFIKILHKASDMPTLAYSIFLSLLSIVLFELVHIFSYSLHLIL